MFGSVVDSGGRLVERLREPRDSLRAEYRESRGRMSDVAGFEIPVGEADLIALEEAVHVEEMSETEIIESLYPGVLRPAAF